MATVKTAISLDAKLFAEADSLARVMRTSRSHLVAEALREFIQRHRDLDITCRLNEVYADPANQPDKEELEGMFRLSVEALVASDSRW